MRTLVILFVLIGSTAYAADPNTNLPPRVVQCNLPAKPCDCNPCTCDPASCKCAACANGCKKAGSAAQEEVAFVGFEEGQTPATPPQAKQGFHTEYRQVCNGTSCQMVAVSVPDGAAYAAGSCATCATGNCATGNCSTGDCSTGSCSTSGRSGPLRRVFGRLFRGRRCGG